MRSMEPALLSYRKIALYAIHIGILNFTAMAFVDRMKFGNYAVIRRKNYALYRIRCGFYLH